MDTNANTATVTVRQFREILLWPLQLEPLSEGRQIQKHWEVLSSLPGGGVWKEVEDEFGEPSEFQERHYAEFVTFLPAVQRFLYGEGPNKAVHAKPVASSLRVFRRCDIAQVRIWLSATCEPVVLDIAHIDLHFFYDLDIVILAVEVYGNELPLDVVQDLLFRFGRAYPANWESDERAATCSHRTEWLDAGGNVLASSDFGDRSKYLAFVCEHRAPLISSHWDFVMHPLVLHTSDEPGPLRYRQLEYYRMPAMAYLAVDDPGQVSRADYVRLAFLSPPGETGELPFSDDYLRGFEHRFCYDRYFGIGGAGRVNASRTLATGHSLVTIGSASSPFFIGKETGFLSQFRHQYFLLFLIAHLHKAALLMMSSRLAAAIQDLDIYALDSVRRFKRIIRQTHETFLRFTHRYWFHEISIQVQAREIYNMLSRHLDNEELYAEVRSEVMDMGQYLDSDNVRRQANVVVRLTVITTVGLVGTTVTGFMGMNVISEADNPLSIKMLYFMLVFVPVLALLLYTVMKSKRLSDFFETLSDERVPARGKWEALAQVWTSPRAATGAAPAGGRHSRALLGDELEQRSS